MPDPPKPLVQRSGRPPLADGLTEIRECRNHGPSPHREVKAGTTRRWKCRRCVAEAVTRRHRKIKQALVSEHGGCCRVCGYDRCLVNLHFHHVDPSTKAFAVSVSHGKSIATYRAEANKCVLVCANCHGEIEAGLIPSPPPSGPCEAEEAA